jgi:hypothetical protein
MSYSQQKNNRYGRWVIISIVAILAIGAYLLLGFSENETTDNDTATTTTANDLINISAPQPGDAISSPLSVSGEARGMWYFEASFPVEIVDNAGNTLGISPAQAQDDWMTENFVPFTGEVAFDINDAETASGHVIFRRSNPSGLTENDAALEIPVTFSESENTGTTNVRVFWNDDAAAIAGDCSVMQGFEREIRETPAVGQASITALLEGPTAAEEAEGFSSSIPKEVTLNSLRIESGTAYADFSSELNQVAGSCRVLAITTQIQETLQQFPTVDSVKISVDGESEGVLQP